MHRIALLQQDETFRSLLRQIETAEADRKFCRHGLTHLLDVARLAWIDVLEHGYDLPKAGVYAAALLHDLGRAAQYAGRAQDHDVAALEDCREILARAGFAPEEIPPILTAIEQHGDKTSPNAQLPLLSAVLRRADGASRPCAFCAAAAECYWTAERRNFTIL